MKLISIDQHWTKKQFAYVGITNSVIEVQAKKAYSAIATREVGRTRLTRTVLPKYSKYIGHEKIQEKILCQIYHCPYNFFYAFAQIQSRAMYSQILGKAMLCEVRVLTEKRVWSDETDRPERHKVSEIFSWQKCFNRLRWNYRRR